MKTSSQICTYLTEDTDENANWRQQYDLLLCPHSGNSTTNGVEGEGLMIALLIEAEYFTG
jgi:hypothetical protein